MCLWRIRPLWAESAVPVESMISNKIRLRHRSQPLLRASCVNSVDPPAYRVVIRGALLPQGHNGQLLALAVLCLSGALRRRLPLLSPCRIWADGRSFSQLVRAGPLAELRLGRRDNAFLCSACLAPFWWRAVCDREVFFVGFSAPVSSKRPVSPISAFQIEAPCLYTPRSPMLAAGTMQRLPARKVLFSGSEKAV